MQPSELTSRERVRLALSHQDSDRVPVDFMATPEAWGRLQEHLGLHGQETVLRYLGIDMRHPRQPYVGPSLAHNSDGSWVDAWGVRRRKVPYKRGAYDEIVEHPLAHLKDASELDSTAGPGRNGGMPWRWRTTFAGWTRAETMPLPWKSSATPEGYSRLPGTCGAWSSS